MRVLVTGAAGFIGSHLSERLCARGDEVIALDNFDAFYEASLKERNLSALLENPRFTLIRGDIRSAQDVSSAFLGPPVDALVHLAALAGVQPSLQEVNRHYQVNVEGTLNLYAISRKQGVSRLVFASSSSVYGLDARAPFSEGDRCDRPLSPYAATKVAGEMLSFMEHHLHHRSATCLRFFTVYGPRQRPDLAIHKFTRLIAEGRPIELYGDGSSSRDYTWIDDIVDGIVAAIDQQRRDRQPGFRIYNLGGSRVTSLRRLVSLISAALGVQANTIQREGLTGDMPHTHADVTAASRDLGYQPRVSIEEGISRFVAWWRQASLEAEYRPERLAS